MRVDIMERTPTVLLDMEVILYRNTNVFTILWMVCDSCGMHVFVSRCALSA